MANIKTHANEVICKFKAYATQNQDETLKNFINEEIKPMLIDELKNIDFYKKFSAINSKIVALFGVNAETYIAKEVFSSSLEAFNKNNSSTMSIINKINHKTIPIVNKILA
jgi:hypothetical protein